MILQKLPGMAPMLFVVSMLAYSPYGITHAQEDKARTILQDMSTKIASLDTFMITGDGYVDARLDAGLIIEHSMDVTLWMERPNAIRISNRDAESRKEIFYEKG